MKNSTWYKNSVAVVLIATTLDLSAMELSRCATSRCIVSTVAALAYGYRAIKPITLFAESADLKKQKSNDEIGAAAAQAGVKISMTSPDSYAWQFQKDRWNEAYQLKNSLERLYCKEHPSDRFEFSQCREAREVVWREVRIDLPYRKKCRESSAEGIQEILVLKKHLMPSPSIADSHAIRAAQTLGKLDTLRLRYEVEWNGVMSEDNRIASRLIKNLSLHNQLEYNGSISEEFRPAVALLEMVEGIYCEEMPFECKKAREYGLFLAKTSKKSTLALRREILGETQKLEHELEQQGVDLFEKYQFYKNSKK